MDMLTFNIVDYVGHMFYEENLTTDEIAKALGLNETEVESMLKRK